jgi:hypothetical protein
MEPIYLVPELDELASDWLDVADLAHMPSLHNFHQMAVCAPDLLGVHFWTRDGQMFVRDGPRFLEYRSYPRLTMRIAGTEAEATSCRWFPHQAVRAGTVDGWKVTTTARLTFEESGLLYELRCRNDAEVPRELDLAVEVTGAAIGDGTAAVVWEDEIQDVLVTAAVSTPDSFERTEQTTTMGWRPTVEPGAEFVIRLVQAEGPGPDDVSERAHLWASEFAEVWAGVEDGWRRRWLDAFTPGNRHFSGNLPVLETDDRAVRRLYYAAVLTLLVLHRTNLALSDRAFVTSGERDKGDVFFWDTSMFSRLFALLEPRAMREQLALFLQVDPHDGAVFNLDSSRFRGGQYLPGYSHGFWYAANDLSLFTLAHDYVAVTGDRDFLAETVGDQTVDEHLRSLATAWRSLDTRGEGLADYGHVDNLLECVPSYVHEVVSLNAANVWMMQSMANGMDRTGDRAEAEVWRGEADSLASRILGRYVPGEGVWVVVDTDGVRRSIRHCYDFICTARFMPERLDDRTRGEMLAFVEHELLTDQWMRALSLADRTAAVSDRPDHGPYGAFDAWPAMAAEAMLLIDAPEAALHLLHRAASATREGPFGQAYEFYGPERDTPRAPIRIAQRGSCLREGSGGGAFAETVVAGLFGFRPDLSGSDPFHDLGPTGFEGTLHHLRYDGRLHRVVRSATGVTVEPE